MSIIKRVGALLVTLGIVSTLSATQNVVSASSEIAQPDPVALLRANHKTISQGRGWAFTSPSLVVRSSLTARTSSGSSQLCSSVEDSVCSPATYSTMLAVSVLGVCVNDAEAACLESVVRWIPRADWGNYKNLIFRMFF